MKREFGSLDKTRFDIIIIGGGIYGCCLAWDAVLRGLSVALIDKEDFSHATSANTARTLHSGFRYLQNLDIKRLRESSRERSVLMRIAPHLVEPAPYVVPAYKASIQCKTVLWSALRLYDLLTIDRNDRITDESRKSPSGYMISRQRCLELAPPGILSDTVTGGAVYFDGLFYNTERLALAYVTSAVSKGAVAVNYAEAQQLLQSPEDGRIEGVLVQDLLSGSKLKIYGQCIINAGGPWINRIMNLSAQCHTQPVPRFARVCSIVTRSITSAGFSFVFKPPHQNGMNCRDAGCCHRYIITSWRGHSIIGSLCRFTDDLSDQCRMREEEVSAILVNVNASFRELNLLRDDVCFVHRGFLPLAQDDQDGDPFKLERHYRIIDHALDGIDGLISVIGVKYTTARDVAEKTIDLVVQKYRLGHKPSRSRFVQLHGGQIQSMSDLLNQARAQLESRLDSDVITQLVRNYGADYPAVLQYISSDESSSEQIGQRISKATDVIRAQVIHAVRNEMAQTLPDVVFRRTELGTLGHPGHAALRHCAQLMASELDWSPERIERELQETEDTFRSYGARARGEPVPTVS